VKEHNTITVITFYFTLLSCLLPHLIGYNLSNSRARWWEGEQTNVVRTISVYVIIEATISQDGPHYDIDCF
jgi:hypothetical protein